MIDSSGKRTAVIFLSCYWLLAVSYPPAMPAAVDYLQPKRLTGSIYDKPGGRLLFTFRRTATQTGDAVRVVREFLSPDGSLAAQERVLYQGGHLRRFELDELQIGASGDAVVQDQQIEFHYSTGSGSSARRKRNVETVRDPVLISDMIPGFLVDHWDELNGGVPVKFRYIVVPRLETIGFKFSRESTDEVKGKKVVRIKMEATSWVIAQALDPLMFTVEAEAPHRILQYWGRTTPKIRSGQTWKDLDALTVFGWE